MYVCVQGYAQCFLSVVILWEIMLLYDLNIASYFIFVFFHLFWSPFSIHVLYCFFLFISRETKLVEVLVAREEFK